MLIINENDVIELFDEFVTKNDLQILNWNKSSSMDLEITELSEFRIVVKVLQNNIGGSYLDIPEKYNEILYNPQTKNSCFWEVLKYNSSVKFTEPIGNIMNSLHMNYNSFVKTTHINKILKFCQKPVRINLYKFNGKEFKRSMYPKTGKAEIIVNMLLEKNHFFGNKNMKRINELKQSEFKIITEDKNEEDEDILPSEFKTKIIDKVNNQKLDLSKDCFWDCETFK